MITESFLYSLCLTCKTLLECWWWLLCSFIFPHGYICSAILPYSLVVEGRNWWEARFGNGRNSLNRQNLNKWVFESDSCRNVCVGTKYSALGDCFHLKKKLKVSHAWWRHSFEVFKEGGSWFRGSEVNNGLSFLVYLYL